MISPETATELAEKQGWKVREHQPSICLLILERSKEQMNVYYSKMTIGTIVPHPKGKKQLFRKNVSLDMFIKLLRRPREHTNKGYATLKEEIRSIPGISETPEKYEDTDQHEMFELSHFESQEELLVKEIWKLKPTYFTGLIARAAMREVAVKRVAEFKEHLESLKEVA